MMNAMTARFNLHKALPHLPADSSLPESWQVHHGGQQ